MFGWLKDLWDFLVRLVRKIFNFVADVADYFGVDLRKILKNSQTKFKTFIHRYVPFLKSEHLRAVMQRVSEYVAELITTVYIRQNSDWVKKTTVEEVDVDDIPPEILKKLNSTGKTVDVTQHVEQKLELELAN